MEFLFVEICAMVGDDVGISRRRSASSARKLIGEEGVC